ncbi:hypothetical protein GPJ56_004874 [Histomonas meleagridis]|uniref:uncharacterized protein n=1 Tax=Histomonas meleagridis TaxID=135588 RepID=UPI00355A21B4|nr:hypothetical protein GPJ56_004874 [Histomonas meleagridis]KAH0803524.1 hypothetical protein GO595_003868 [Histomonas meleagridis]
MAPKREIIVPFIIGAGALGLFFISVAACAYNALYVDDNTYSAQIFGINIRIKNITLVIAIFSIITAVLLLIASIIYLVGKYPFASIMLFIFSIVAAIIYIACQIIGLSFTRYGPTPVPQIYNYYDDADFRSYYDNYSYTGFGQVVASLGYASYDSFRQDHPDLYVSFYVSTGSDYLLRSIPSCSIDATQSNLNSASPCDYSIVEDKCVGDWTGESFKDYLCDMYNQRSEINETAAGGHLNEGEKLAASIERKRDGVDSFAAYYSFNSFLLGFEIVVLIILLIALIVNAIMSVFCAKPKSSNKKPQQKAQPKQQKQQPKQPVKKSPPPPKKEEPKKKDKSESSLSELSMKSSSDKKKPRKTSSESSSSSSYVMEEEEEEEEEEETTSSSSESSNNESSTSSKPKPKPKAPMQPPQQKKNIVESSSNTESSGEETSTSSLNLSSDESSTSGSSS